MPNTDLTTGVQVMAKQLRYAMYNCIEMDADFRLAESEMGTSWEEAADTDDTPPRA